MMLLLFLFGLVATSINALGERKDVSNYIYDPTPLTWEVDVFQNGTMRNMTGTVEQVYAQILEINPAYEFVEHESTALETRDANPKDGWNNCGMDVMQRAGWWWARTKSIQEGQQYLKKVPGSPWLDAGPGKCQRVSCSWDSGIWWCNDNHTRVFLNNFGEIADCVQPLLDDFKKCGDDEGWIPPISVKMVCGQHFTPDNWNCIAKKEDC